MPQVNYIDALFRSIGAGAKRLGERAMAKGLDAVFEDAEKLAVEAQRRVGKARRRLDAMGRGEPFKEDDDEETK